MAHRSAGEWVDPWLLAGADGEVCLTMGASVTRGELAQLVGTRQRDLEEAGLGPGGTACLVLPPSLSFASSLLAAWRLGAQVSLLDHRLAKAEKAAALDRLAPQVVVEATAVASPPMAAYAQVESAARRRAEGRPAQTPHALIQLSSGSTGPSKVIARTAQDLTAELDRYSQLPEYPKPGHRIVLLASIVHVLGLVGGLLHSLHAGVELVYPDRVTADGIRTAVAWSGRPTMLLGVPFHAELLAAAPGERLPQLTRMVVAGELVRPGVPGSFSSGYGVPLGTMYGMTERGVIATDLDGSRWPAVAPAPGMTLRVEDGELLVATDVSPYIGLVDPTRWADGWLRTRDAAVADPGAGLVTILGRLDSQVSVGGLKVDLTEVEQTLAAVPGVGGAVLAFDGAIEAYLVLRGASLGDVEAALADRLAPYKRPRRWHVLDELPRTATGKVVRDRAVLRARAGAAGKPR